MPLAITLAKAVLTAIKDSNLVDKIGGPAIAIGSYLAWDNKDKISNPFGSAPSGTNTVSVPFGSAPTVPAPYATPPTASSVVKSQFDEFVASLNNQQTSTITLSEALALVGDTTQARNDTLLQSAGNSKFLRNQAEGKAAIDEVSMALNSQNIIHSMIYETLDRNLSLISTSLAVSAASTSLAHNLNNSSDLPYVDMDTFYTKLTQSNPLLDAYRLSHAANIENEIISGMTAQGATYPEIKASVTRFRTGYFSSAEISGVNTALAGITVPSIVNVSSAPVVNVSVPAQAAPVVNIDTPDYSPYMERIAARADSAKIVDQHASTVRDISDLDGNIVARAAPMEIVAARNAAHAREKTDIINETFDDTDNPLGGFDLMPFINFVGRSDTFDKTKPLSNLFKPDGV